MLLRPRFTAALLIAAAVLLITGCTVQHKARDDRQNGEPGKAKVDVIVAPSTARLQPRSDPASFGGTTTSIRLAAARGEREGAQLIASSRGGSPRLTLVTSELRGPGGSRISARHVRGYLEQVLRVEHGSPGGRSGEYTDPLIPAAQRDVVLAPDEQLFAWVDVETPVDAAPGVYRGAVELRAATRSGKFATGPDGVLASVPLHLTVHAATLAKRPTLGSSIGVDASQIARLEHIDVGSGRLRTALDTYSRTLADARLSMADVGVFPPRAVPGSVPRPGDAAYLQRVFDRRGVASVRIPFYMDSPFADPLGVDRPAALRYLRAAGAWARTNGWIDRAYVYAIDEPDSSRADEVKALRALLHQADPKLRLLVTREFGAAEFRAATDIYVPNISATRFSPAQVIAARKLGKTTWWYPSITTQQPQPDLFVDDLRAAPRALGWLAWRYGVRGLLYWSATHWHEVEDPYRESATYRQTDVYGNGDGVLVYPGRTVGHRGTPSPSVRLFELRDGIDDHDLFTMASCVAHPPAAAQLRAAIARLAPSMTMFDSDAAGITAVRDRAFRLLDAAPAPVRTRCQS
jgi:hypothetical protein